MLIQDWLALHPDACEDAQEWLLSRGPDATMDEAWRLCSRPDWMLWAIFNGTTKPDHRAATLWAATLWTCDALESVLLRMRWAGREPNARVWQALRSLRRYAQQQESRIDLLFAKDKARGAANFYQYQPYWEIVYFIDDVIDLEDGTIPEDDEKDDANPYSYPANAAAASVCKSKRSLMAERSWQADRLRLYFRPKNQRGGSR